MKNYIHKLDFGKTNDNVEKMEKTMTKVEKEARRVKKDIHRKVTSFRAVVIAISIGLMLAVAALAYTFYVVSNWYAEHKVTFRQLLLVQNPVVISKIVVMEKEKPKKLSEAELVAADKIRKEKEREAFIERLYQATRFLESRVGFDKSDSTATHLYCQGIGKINEVGYFPDTDGDGKGNRDFCFSDEAEQRLTLTRWFGKRLDGMTAQEALCLYVTGLKQPMCKRVMEVGL